ncbi:hypothetical protein D9615_001277 [Tricholomella constricta]|uniref:Guanine nucleotide-binding protein-like 1 n=1 Tax=Tricholomella constricta TaxID=117010 RepID=A0A8H5HL55_9AGAR|nr:hypothetical protein D9615_001277 [Tricholomella constricta]
MPPRRKPTSSRQKKADIQLKRAIKRGDVQPPDPQKKIRRPKFRRGPTGNFIGSAADPARVTNVQAARRLQSTFVTLPPKFLEDTKFLASTLPLHRPIQNEIAVFSDSYSNAGNPNAPQLTCPRRPKWRFNMSKKEVEHNEEGVFKIWLEQMDGVVAAWQHDKGSNGDDRKNLLPEQQSAGPKEVLAMPRSPTYFERNLEVWRQLYVLIHPYPSPQFIKNALRWRVTEISQILLVLLDSRCPLLHFPPSLSAHLSDQKVILVLTKVDISGPVRAAAWVEYFHKRYPHLRVVQVESYTVKAEGVGHQGKTQYEPHLPESFRERLVANIREVHAEMLLPLEKVKHGPSWKPLVKQDIDWDAVLQARGSRVGSAVGGAAHPRPTDLDHDETAESRDDKEPEFLTIGLIGQPNVGKSSLLNALFGANRVRASKTPGKTKHFQTLFWTPDVRLVDCPGLVMPNFVPLEMQVLCGVLPISRVSAVPSCIHYASERIPIERIYKLTHPSLSLPSVPDRRTWREGMKPEPAEGKNPPVWTAMDILTTYANLKKWVTAKAGRPDIHRAGNAILRALAEGRIGWAFWPPGTDTKTIAAITEEPGTGLWIPCAIAVDEETEEDSETDEEEEARERAEMDSEEENTESDDDNNSDDGQERRPSGGVLAASRFDALAIDDVEEEDYNDT